jgi:spore maturation protein CgeB
MEGRDKLKIVYAYTIFQSAAYGDVRAMNEKYIGDLNKAGFNVEGFCLTLDPPNDALTFKELDRKWKWGDPTLFNMYEELERKIDGKDVLINASGVNLHPQFVERLPIFTVYQCFDDPESSEHRSKPTAFSYDLSLVGNIAEVDTYKSWGVKNVDWTCLGLMHGIFDKNVTYESILNGERDIDLFMMIDKTAPWRRERLNKIDTAFTEAHFYGKGWKRGLLPREKEVEMLTRTKVGPNIHNSTGPINLRTFYLPANGVMQVCDNKSHLGKLFELNKEVVGFDTIEECIDLCRYYLEHDEKRREIAANGWKRVMTDYTEEKVFERTYEIISSHLNNVNKRKDNKISSGFIYKSRPGYLKALHFVYSLSKNIYLTFRRTAKAFFKEIRIQSNL